MSRHLYTAESVSCGHPDKIADQISDSILDACLAQDPDSRVACETLVTQGLVVLSGEITTKATLEYSQIVRETVKSIGYNDPQLGFDSESCGIVCAINKQSEDIAIGVNESEGLYGEQGAGDQGIMCGFACDETDEFLPLPFYLATRLISALRKARESGTIPYLKPDAKSQITVEYDKEGTPKRLHTVVISTQHAENISYQKINADVTGLIEEVLGKHGLDENTRILINPTGRFVVGGPVGDCGLTGRKLMVDTYGGMAHHGGGAFSGKDPTKVDRSAAYACRYIAKNIVAAKIAKKVEVHVAYAIGVAEPIALRIDTFGTSSIAEETLEKMVRKVFNLTPKGIIESLNLKRPIYQQTAAEGHFGRNDLDLPWEKIDKVADINAFFK